MKKIINVIFYAFIAMLFVFYLFILYIGLYKPNVCIEYKLYYVDKVLQDWTGYGGLDYNGEKLIFDIEESSYNNLRGDRNWHYANNEIWMTDKECSLYFGNVKDKIVDISMEIKDVNNVDSIQVLVDGQVLHKINCNSNEESYKLNLPYTIKNQQAPFNSL